MRTALPHLRGFARSQDGVAVVEFALLAPFLALLLMGCITFGIVFENANRAEAATYTVADIVSRQTTVTSDFMRTTYAMFVKMLPASQTGVSFRVSSLKKADGKFTVGWSYPVPPMTALVDSAIPAADLPLVANGDSLIFVETQVGYTPISTFGGLTASTYANTAANRPRFTSAVTKTD